MLSTPSPTCFLIADISGYTSYLGGVELEHAQDVLGDLLGVIVSGLQPVFDLSRVEGDGAFMYAQGDRIDGSLLLDVIESCYFAFRHRRRDVRQATTCGCNACVRISDLDLKFIVHHGPALVHAVAGQRELVGFEAIVVHRMSKNDVVSRLNMPAYALISTACADAVGLEPAALGLAAHAQDYDSVGVVEAWAHDLQRRFDDEEERRRVYVDADRAILSVTTEVNVPRQVAWDFLTRPGQRMSWQPWVTSVDVQGATGGRRGVGSSNHCMHGADAVVEEILDWRPYDYVTDRTTVETPAGPVSMLHTIEFTAVGGGTSIDFRFAAPDDPDLATIASEIGSAYGPALRSALPALVAQLEATPSSATT